jgi:hypothetical protein
VALRQNDDRMPEGSHQFEEHERRLDRPSLRRRYGNDITFFDGAADFTAHRLTAEREPLSADTNEDK